MHRLADVASRPSLLCPAVKAKQPAEQSGAPGTLIPEIVVEQDMDPLRLFRETAHRLDELP
jgi:hypothetical protein